MPVGGLVKPRTEASTQQGGSAGRLTQIGSHEGVRVAQVRSWGVRFTPSRSPQRWASRGRHPWTVTARRWQVGFVGTIALVVTACSTQEDQQVATPQSVTLDDVWAAIEDDETCDELRGLWDVLDTTGATTEELAALEVAIAEHCTTGAGAPGPDEPPLEQTEPAPETEPVGTEPVIEVTFETDNCVEPPELEATPIVMGWQLDPETRELTVVVDGSGAMSFGYRIRMDPADGVEERLEIGQWPDLTPGFAAEMTHTLTRPRSSISLFGTTANYLPVEGTNGYSRYAVCSRNLDLTVEF